MNCLIEIGMTRVLFSVPAAVLIAGVVVLAGLLLFNRRLAAARPLLDWIESLPPLGWSALILVVLLDLLTLFDGAAWALLAREV